MDVLIIGGGVIGVSTAYVLAKSGVRTTLIERGDICSGSSHGNAGLICPCHSTPVPGPGVLSQGMRWMLNPESPFYIHPRLDFEFFSWLLKFRKYCNEESQQGAIPVLRDMQRASLALYQDWLRDNHIEADFEKRGGLELFLTEKKLNHGRHEVDRMRNHGIQMRLLNRDEVHTLEPALSPDVIGGIYYEEDAHIDPAKFVHRLAKAAADAGAEILDGTSVDGLVLTANRIRGVRTPKGEFTAKEIVVAAGAWSTPLLKGIGLRLAMQPGKGYSITMTKPEVCPKIPLHLAEARMAITPIGDTLRFAGTMELAGLQLAANERRLNAIRRGGYQYLATREKLDEREIWSGLRPIPPDGMPYIGRVPGIDNLTIATGHAMLGVSMGPITGHLIAEVLHHTPPSIPLDAFRINRFG